MNLKKCGICDEEKDNGIFIYHMYICEACEKKIVTTDVDNKEYQLFVEKLKGINQTYTI
ncbi:uncharacterized protein YlaI [Gracilibacillus halotolerans]|uniref:Uncharacterized protein YlaI n=1 Tax=Gracilibacillus halotolerans TaxID=74386 RepID=A0A841RQ06_9BACI|nr:sigma factor G inhibitor Gin [Gracilibacillus halotolerans]MBB6513937.1 uncharacterized protein YlaI [Gracilibacillus halotolerans]